MVRWQEHADRFRKSGLSRLEYCRENGIKDHQFRYWIPRLLEKQSAKKSGFAKAVVSEEPTFAKQEIKNGVDARLTAGSGTILEFHSSADPRWIALIVSAIGGI